MTYIYSENLRFKLGWQYKVLELDYQESFAGVDRVSLGSEPNIKSLFFNSIYRPSPIFSLNIGTRLSKYFSLDEILIDPRIAIKYNPLSDLAIKFSWGQFSQFLYTINQDEELLRIVDFRQPIPTNGRPQRSEHYILGGEYWISNGNTISIEGYYKPYTTVYDLSLVADPVDVNSYFSSGIGTESVTRISFTAASFNRGTAGPLNIA